MNFRRRTSDPCSDPTLVVGRGERTLLRRAVLADRAEYVAARQQSRALHARWITLPESAPGGDADHGFASWCSETESDRRRVFFVCRATDGALAGGIALSEIVRGDFQSAYCGYWAAAASVGCGHMTEGLALLLDHAFGPLGLHRVEANIQPENEPSLALVRRLGFRCEGFSPRYLRINGVWCDHERWAILSDEWRAT